MALVRRPIKQLQLDSNFVWLLDYFGGLVVNPRDERQESVECILTPCTPHPQHQWKLQRRLAGQVIATVGVNAIGTLQLGHQVQNGEFIKSSVSSSLEEIVFLFDSRKLTENNEIYLNKAGIVPASALINYRLSAEGVNSAVKLIDGELLKTDNQRSPDRDASQYKPHPIQVLFHELEIIRFYYTNSAHLNDAIFGGDFSDNLLYRKIVSNLHEGPHRQLDSKTARFEYKSGFNFEDAILLGRILFEDPSAALEGVRRIHLSKLVTRANEVNPNFTGYPRTKFPYLQKVVLKLKGRRIKLVDGRFIFLVHRIEECNAKFPFHDLSFQRVVEPGGPPPPEGAPEAYPNKKTQTGPGQHQGAIDTEARPTKNSIAAASSPEMRRFTLLDVNRCNTEKARPSTHSSAKSKPPIFNPKLENSSAGTPTWTDTNAVRQEVRDKFIRTEENEEDKRNVDKASIDLELFKNILESLKKHYGINSINPISITSGQTDKNEPQSGDGFYSFFPVIACPERKSLDRQFSFLNKSRNQRRKLICASLEINERLFYLLEAERRLNDDNAYMDDLPILLVWMTNFETVDMATLYTILVNTVKNPSKTWPRHTSFLNLNQRRIDHDKMRSPDVVANRIIKFIEEI